MGYFGEIATRLDFGVPFSQELFYKLFDKNLTIEDGPFEVEL